MRRRERAISGLSKYIYIPTDASSEAPARRGILIVVVPSTIYVYDITLEDRSNKLFVSHISKYMCQVRRMPLVI